MSELLRGYLTEPAFLLCWGALALTSLMVLLDDLKYENPEITGLMRWVWIFTVAYSGLLGLGIYFAAGRKQILRDSLWRRGFRSVAHCYAGCGAGEIVGVVLAVALLSFGNFGVAAVTFCFAYAAGFALTVGPLMQDGVPMRRALKDAAWSETASIAVMEFVAIGVDLWLAGNAGIADRLFWASLVVSLTCGLLAAWPVNVLLIRLGVKEGMHDPREHAAHAR